MTATTTPENTVRIAVLVGSLRAGSVNRKLAELLRDEAPEGVALEIVEGLGELPFFNEDIEDPAPAKVAALRQQIADADRVLVVTPEYNGSIPGVLKNAIDWLSRPYAAGVIRGKVLGVVGTTPTPYGGKWAHEHTVHSGKLAGAVVVEDVTVSQSAIEVDVLADQEVRTKLQDAIRTLVDFEPETAVA